MKTAVEKCAKLINVIMDDEQDTGLIDVHLDNGTVYLKDTITNERSLASPSTLIASAEHLGLNYIVSDDFTPEQISSLLVVRNMNMSPEMRHFTYIEFEDSEQPGPKLDIFLMDDWFMVIYPEHMVRREEVALRLTSLTVNHLMGIPEFQPAADYVTGISDKGVSYVTGNPNKGVSEDTLYWENEYVTLTLNIDGLFIFIPKNGSVEFTLASYGESYTPVPVPANQASALN